MLEHQEADLVEKQGRLKIHDKILNFLLGASNDPDAPKKSIRSKLLDFVKPAPEKESVIKDAPEFLTWKSRTVLFFGTLGMSLGLGQIWRFPALAYKLGGGTFVIIYACTIASIGNAMFFLETATGQYSSKNPAKVYDKVPIFIGLGWAMIVYSFFFCIYYNHLVSLALYYMFSSFAQTPPWSYCPIYDPDSTVHRCMPYSWVRSPSVDGVICGTKGFIYNRTRLCEDPDYALEQQITCCDFAEVSGWSCQLTFNVSDLCLPRKYPAEFHWKYTVNDEYRPDDPNYGYLGKVIPALFGASFFAWFLVYIILYKGVKSFQLVMYVIVPSTYILLFMMFALTIPHEGALNGLFELLLPTFESFSDINVWRVAVEQAFYSIAVGMGFLITIGSYSKFSHTWHIDGFFICICVFITSALCSLAVFSVLGYLASKTQRPFDEVVDAGPGVLFIAYPASLNMFEGSSFFSIVFFFMLVTLGLSSVCSIIQTVSSAVCDIHPILRRFRYLVNLGIICTCFLLGIPITARGGIDVFNAFDIYGAGLTLIPIVVIELLVVLVFYKIGRFGEDISFMLGFYPSRYYRLIWATGLFLLLPIFIYSLVVVKVKNLNMWAQILGWLLFVCIIAIIPTGMIYKIVEYKGVLKNVIKSPPEHGPKDPINKEERMNYRVKRMIC